MENVSLVSLRVFHVRFHIDFRKVCQLPMELIHASLQTLKLYSRKCRSTSEYPYYPYLKFESELLYVTLGAHFWPRTVLGSLLILILAAWNSVLHHEASCPITTSGISNDFYEQSAMTWKNPWSIWRSSENGGPLYHHPNLVISDEETNCLGHPYWSSLGNISGFDFFLHRPGFDWITT